MTPEDIVKATLNDAFLNLAIARRHARDVSQDKDMMLEACEVIESVIKDIRTCLNGGE